MCRSCDTLGTNKCSDHNRGRNIRPKNPLCLVFFPTFVSITHGCQAYGKAKDSAMNPNCGTNFSQLGRKWIMTSKIQKNDKQKDEGERKGV